MDDKLSKWLENPPKKFRPIPFWSWNEKLDTAETVRQISLMEEAGLGGYFMHARGGLQTEYMSEEWFDNIAVGINEGEARNMQAWGYDENGWPSGFGNGIVNGLGIEYQQKYLRCRRLETETEIENRIAIIKKDGAYYHFYFEVNPFYVDTLDDKVTAEFIKAVHEKYKSELGDNFAKMAGFFTDEPQISRDGTPWSLILPAEYKNRYGEELLPLLIELFYPMGGFERTRVRFWSMVRDLFADNYMKPIYDWCQENNLQLTGHMVLEETLQSQLTSNGACMPCYEFFDIPGMDWLTRSKVDRQTPIQLASVAHQLGKKQILSETFALTGWNVSFEELKWLYEQQMVRGINLLCQHLEGYSLRGIRKRDYPPSLFYQQPWFGEYKCFNDAMSRIGMLLSEGSVAFDVLLLHPQSSAWICYDDDKNEGLHELEIGFEKTMAELENNQIPYHLGDEWIIERHGSVSEARLVVGIQSYSVVIVPPCKNISKRLLELLGQFKQNGGKLLFSQVAPTHVEGENSVALDTLIRNCEAVSIESLSSAIPTDINRILLTELSGDKSDVFATIRELGGGCKLYYIVNSSKNEKNIKLDLSGKYAKRLDYFTGEQVDFDNASAIRLDAMGSILLFVYPQVNLLEGKWEIKSIDENAIALDYCKCSFDGELVAEKIHINNVQELACSRFKPVNIELIFELDILELPSEQLYLVLETPQNFDIRVNEQPVSNAPSGFYFDKEFKKIPLGGALKIGNNTIKLTTGFSQTAEVYQNIKNSAVFESEKNKLSYCDEIEAIYVVGNFSVETNGVFEKAPKNAVIYDGGFAIKKIVEELELGSIVEQGFPFFAGSVTYKKAVTISESAQRSYKFSLDGHGFTIAKITLNGKAISKLVWAPFHVQLELALGENVIEIEIIGNLRNLLGPHHLSSGESYVVAPFDFFQNSPLWSGGVNDSWSDKYCFVQFGLSIKE